MTNPTGISVASPAEADALGWPRPPKPDEFDLLERYTASLTPGNERLWNDEAEPVPAAVDGQKLEIVYSGGSAFQRFSRYSCTEIWVTVIEPHDELGRPHFRRRVAFAVAVDGHEREASALLVPKLEKTLARFNRDMETVHALARGEVTRWQRFRSWLGVPA